MRNTVLLISSVIICVIIFTFISCNGDKLKEAKAEVIKEEASKEESLDLGTGNDIYITDNINDENVSTINESSTTVSYWYVYYNVHRGDPESFWTGYDVVELSTPYFDIGSAIRQVFPQYTDKDFVGIEYFKRVPIETYKSHREAEDK